MNNLTPFYRMKKYFQASWQWKYLGVAALASIFYLAINFIICLVIIYADWKIPGYRLEEVMFSLSGKGALVVSLIAIGYVLIIPAIEEVILRGFTLKYLTLKIGTKKSIPLTILISILILLPLHNIIPALIFSSIATIITAKNASIWPAVLFHIANNAIIFILLLLAS